MDILGISAFYHDSAAAIIRDGVIIAAAQEERFTRKKGDSSFPHNAISFCLEKAEADIDDINYIIFYEDPKEKFDRLITTHHLMAPYGWRSFVEAMPAWLTSKLWMEKEIGKELGTKKRIICCDHHVSHAASAFFPSPFSEAAIITIDGVGEWSTTAYGVGKGNKINLMKHIKFPNSLGLLYSAFTYYTGFKINRGEYKLMGLAPYGKPLYYDLIKEKLIKTGEGGSFAINQKYFNYTKGLTMINDRFCNLFGQPPREPESEITQFHMDIASSIQKVINEHVLAMGRHVHRITGLDNLVIAGGVGLNCVANGLLSRYGPFKKIWVQPAAGDAGGALGAAFWLWYQALGKPRKPVFPDAMQGSFLGEEISLTSERDDRLLKEMGAIWELLDEDLLPERIAEAVSSGKVVGVARGRSEWGPRALGARSILGDARLPQMQSHMNMKIKSRESFRPFAPMVLEEDAGKYFEMAQDSPYMLTVYPVKDSIRRPVEDKNMFGLELLKQDRSEIPAVTHVDFSARIQTVDRERNPFIWSVLKKFKDKTSCSVMINTSFNVRGEPIVNTIGDAYRCFMATKMDCLVLGNRFMERAKQKPPLKS